MTAAGRPADVDRDAACARRLEAAGFRPGQARELAARIREEVSALPPPGEELLEQLRALLDLSGEVPGRGAA